ncbi:hypothetical protein [Candidatus Tokpelaia sp.]|uniref:hypothetical protein n=1 Tax=Candidatus Tokpelaia sp. TaxID=2233777 RepID=UPI0016804E45|nr:hypothetical protein [Candidatus Tokpelaia sp.]
MGEQQILLQKLQQAREELRHVSTARQAGEKSMEIAALETQIKKLGYDDAPF